MENVYSDLAYAEGYAALEWQGTYYLLARDLPGIFHTHCKGIRALDFGCGAGRSTRLLRSAGFEAVGIDVAQSMVDQAVKIDPGHDYRVIVDGDFSFVEPASFDLILSCFPFDNIPGVDHKIGLLSGLSKLLAPGGVLVNIVSSSEIYWNEWATFTTQQFPENKTAQDGDVVKIVTKDFQDLPVCYDILFGDDSYRSIYKAAELHVVGEYRPLGAESDPVDWISETTVAPWVIWVLSATHLSRQPTLSPTSYQT
ncbi:MAG TPA: methyltransferase [Fimbriimonas sp.]|nr:methyltransferase [Fimbriimonas sp.]